MDCTSPNIQPYYWTESVDISQIVPPISSFVGLETEIWKTASAHVK